MPVSLLMTVVSGCSSSHSPQVVRTLGEDFQPDPGASERPDHRLAAELVPKRLGGPVVHQFVAAIEHTGGAELGGLAVDLGGIHDSRTAESSIGQGELHPSNGVIGHLMGVENAQGISPVLAVD